MASSRPACLELELTREDLRGGVVPVPTAALGFFLDELPGPRRITLHLEGQREPLRADLDRHRRVVASRRWPAFFARHGLAAGDRLLVSRFSRSDYGVWARPRG